MATEMVCSHHRTMYDASTGTYNKTESLQHKQFESMFSGADLHRELRRFQTYLLWPPTAQAKPEELAEAGFFFTGSEDTCQCHFCGVRLKNWRLENLPREVHEKHSPLCKFIQGRCNNVPIEEDDETPPQKRAAVMKAKKDRVQADSGSVKRKTRNGHKKLGENDAMKTRKARLESYNGKWRKHEIVTPEELVDAGFYYGKDKDRVICAYCGIKLVGWQPGDTAYGEHFKHSPACPFITAQVIEEEPTGLSDLYLSFNDSGEDSEMSKETAVSMARQFGHSEKVIQRAVDILTNTGAGFNTTSLLDAIYKIQDTLCAESGIPEPADLVEEEDEKVEEDPEMLKLKEENARLKMRCLACGENKAAVLLLPCRHLVSCSPCSSKLKKCPKCQGVIKGVVKTYFA